MNKTLYSIILPVHNGGSHIKLCIESILSQTLSRFELVILENQSTDETYEYLLSLSDSRIRIIPSASLLSIEENWQRVLITPKNEFMTIIGHDDTLDPNYLEVMDNLIRENPEATLYQAHFRLIDADGKFIRNCLPMPTRETASDFLAARLANIRDSFGTGYMIRSKDYDQVRGIPQYPKLIYADDALWIKLMQFSWKATANDRCFSYRLHKGSTSGGVYYPHLFLALEQYVLFLEELSLEQQDIKNVIELYGRKYFLDWCNRYYIFLLEQSYDKNISLSSLELQRIYSINTKFFHDVSLESVEDNLIKAMKLIARLPYPKIVYSALNKNQKLGLKIALKILKYWN